MRSRLRIQLLLLCLTPALALIAAPGWAQFSAVRVTDQLNRPVLATAPAGDPRIFVVEQGGRIRIWDGVGLSTYLDLSLLVSGAGEQGLLGLAFAPDYASSGLFYVHYTDLSGDSVISRFNVSAGDPDLADPLSEEMLLVVPQPFANHNAGHLAFSPVDGLLYIAMGDGGLGGDPGENGQDPSTLLGSILRIDVSSAPGFTVPANNPFVGGGGDPLVWSYGFRNPYRFSFDRSTGDLWIGDVGQGAVEEIDFQPASSTGGENYGWDCFEGSVPFEPAGCPLSGTSSATTAARSSRASRSPRACSPSRRSASRRTRGRSTTWAASGRTRPATSTSSICSTARCSGSSRGRPRPAARPSTTGSAARTPWRSPS